MNISLNHCHSQNKKGENHDKWIPNMFELDNNKKDLDNLLL
jgi:hypothetical protein